MSLSEQIDEILRGSFDDELILLHSGQSDLYYKAVDVSLAGAIQNYLC